MEAPERGAVRRGLGLAAMSFGVSVVVGLGSSIATSRLYGIEVIGEYALASAPYLIVSQLSSVDEQTAFVREAATLPRRDLRMSALFRAVFGFSILLTSTLAVVAFAISALLLRGPIDRPDLVLPSAVILLGYALVDNTNWNIDAVLSAFRASEVLFLARTAQVLTFLAAGVLLVTVWHSVWGLVVATVLSFAVPFVVRVSVLHRYVALRVPVEHRRAARSELPALLRFGVVLVPGKVVNGAVQQSGTWIVGAVGNVAATGSYSRALGLSSKLSEAGYRISEILLPGMMEKRVLGDDPRHLLARTVRLCAVLLLLVTAPGAGAATGVLTVFGDGFEKASAVLAMLLVAYAFTVLDSVQLQYHLAEGRPGRVTRYSLGKSAVTIALLFVLAPRYGAGGVALAYLVGGALLFVVLDRGLALDGHRSLLGLGRLLALVVTWGAAFATSWGVQRWSTGIPTTVAALGAGALVAVVLVVAFGLVEADERRQLVARVRR